MLPVRTRRGNPDKASTAASRWTSPVVVSCIPVVNTLEAIHSCFKGKQRALNPNLYKCWGLSTWSLEMGFTGSCGVLQNSQIVLPSLRYQNNPKPQTLTAKFAPPPCRWDLRVRAVKTPGFAGFGDGVHLYQRKASGFTALGCAPSWTPRAQYP